MLTRYYQCCPAMQRGISMRHTLFVIVFMLAGCSFVPKNASELLANQKDSPFDSSTDLTLSLEQKSRLVPQFNVGVAGFDAQDQDPPTAGATDAQKIYARTFTVTGKLYKLKALDFIRFVINTPEFEEALLKTKFILKRGGSGALGTSLATDVADPKRVLAIIRDVQLYNVIISKRNMPTGIGAQALLGANRYDDPTSKFNKPYTNIVWFRNDEILENWPHSNFQGYMAGVFFHEMLHNLGFNHDDNIGGEDVVYGTQRIFGEVTGKQGFLTKYATQLARFRPYYEKRYSNFLVSDTLVGIAANQSRSRSLQATPEFEPDPDAIICITYEDGTSKMMTYAESQALGY